MDLQAITKSITEIGELAKAGNVEVTKQLAKITEHTASSDARILDLEQKMLTGKPSGGKSSASRFAFGELAARDPKMEALRRGDIQQARVTVPGSLAAICKSVLVQTGTSGTSPEFGFPTAVEYISPTPQSAPGRRLLVLQSLPHMPVSLGAAVFPQITSTSDGAAVQEYQGGAKGESTLQLHAATLKMATVASFLNASRQLLDDVETLPVFLQTWLGYFVLRKYENLICAGSGSAADGTISGLTVQGTPFTSAATYAVDRIGQAAFQALPSYGYSADTILLNSGDWFNIVSQRSPTTEQYIIAGGWAAQNGSTLWGIRAVPTPAMPSGTAVVLDSQLVAILDRSEIVFLIGTTGSQFTQNEFTYLSELRGQLMVVDPHAVQVVTLT